MFPNKVISLIPDLIVPERTLPGVALGDIEGKKEIRVKGEGKWVLVVARIEGNVWLDKEGTKSNKVGGGRTICRIGQRAGVYGYC